MMSFEERLSFLSSPESGGRDEIDEWRREFARRNALEQGARERLEVAEEARRRWMGDDDADYEFLEGAEQEARADIRLARTTA